jgi:hypothetical protein
LSFIIISYVLYIVAGMSAPASPQTCEKWIAL